MTEREKKPRRIGGREATTAVIPGNYAISVGNPQMPLPAGWDWRLLTELARLESGHTPSRKKKDYWGGDIPWIGIRDATANHGRTIFATNENTNELGIANSAARVLPQHTVCLSRTASVGYVVVMGRPMATSQDFVNWVCGPELDYRYLKYALIAEGNALLRFADGSVHQTIYFPEVKALHIALPELGEQNAIADVLSALDDKIELNRRMNETLEALAQAVFKDWFVDFGPVRRKQEGATDPVAILGGLIPDPAKAAPVAALFPEGFGEDGLPEGWEIGPFSNQIEIIGGGTPKTSKPEYWDGDIPWFSVADTPNGSDTFVFETEKAITREGLVNSSARLVGPGTTIITARGTVGNLAVAGCEMTFNQSCYALKASAGEAPYFTFLSTKRIVERLQSMAHGSVFSTITRQTFDNVDAARPPLGVRDAFEDLVDALFVRVRASVLENRTLAETRDYLLPRLMSGEVRVRDAEKMAE